MKQQKAKYYHKTGKIKPLESILNLTALDSKQTMAANGSDEDGNYVIVDYITDDPKYFAYNVDKNDEGNDTVIIKQIKEEEWNQLPEINIENIPTQNQDSSASADVSFLKRFMQTSLKQLQAIYQMVKRSLSRITESRCYDASSAPPHDFPILVMA